MINEIIAELLAIAVIFAIKKAWPYIQAFLTK